MSILTSLRHYPSVLLLAGLLLFAGDAGARLVIDGMGRRIVVPDNPVRVVALAPSITETVFALGQEQRLVGISRFSDFPPEARRLPQVGPYVQPDIEKIMALNPDVCIAIKDGNPQEVADKLKSLHIPVYAVDPLNLESVMTMVQQIGDLLDAKARAQAIVAGMRFRIGRVKEKVMRTQQRPGVFFQIGISPIVSVGNGTVIDDLIRMAGGKNLCEGYSAYPRLSREQVLVMSPDVIIVSTMLQDVPIDQIKAEWAGWPQIPAVRDGRISVVDSDIFNRPTPRQVDALEQLARMIHPELFKDSP